MRNTLATITTLLLTAGAASAQARTGNLKAVSVTGPSLLNPRTTATFRTTIANTADVGVNIATSAALYLSTNTAITTHDQLLVKWANAPIKAHKSTQSVVQFTVPYDIGERTYYVGVIADPEKFYPEPNEDDNTAYKRVTGAGMPDLEIISSTTPAKVLRGQNARLGFTVKNKGGVNASTFKVGIYLSKDALLDARDQRFASITVNSLRTESTFSNTRFHQIPANADLGTCYILYVADYERKIIEISERNTEADRTICGHWGNFQRFGTGCVGALGVPRQTVKLLSGNQPEPGARVQYEIHNGLRNYVSVWSLGLSKHFWGRVRLPLTLNAFGAPGCRLYQSLDVLLPVSLDNNGSGKIAMPIPDNRDLVGKQFHTQYLVLDAMANEVGVTFSEAYTTEIGGQ